MLGAKGYVKLWISVDEHGRLSWRVSPGMPEKNSVSLKYYSVREGPGQTDFRLVLKDDSPQNLRKEVLMKSMSVGDRHRWVAGLQSWCKESKKKDEDQNVRSVRARGASISTSHHITFSCSKEIITSVTRMYHSICLSPENRPNTIAGTPSLEHHRSNTIARTPSLQHHPTHTRM